MNPEELLLINESANKKIQLLRKQQKERFIKLKAKMDEYIKTGNLGQNIDIITLCCL